jgi:hypothetical protein
MSAFVRASRAGIPRRGVKSQRFVTILKRASINSAEPHGLSLLSVSVFQLLCEDRIGRYFDTGPTSDTMKQIPVEANLWKTPVVKEHLARMVIGANWPRDCSTLKSGREYEISTYD